MIRTVFSLCGPVDKEYLVEHIVRGMIHIPKPPDNLDPSRKWPGMGELSVLQATQSYRLWAHNLVCSKEISEIDLPGERVRALVFDNWCKDRHPIGVYYSVEYCVKSYWKMRGSWTTHS